MRRKVLTIAKAALVAAATVTSVLFTAYTSTHTYRYDGLNAGIVVDGIGYEWRGDPGWFIEEDSPFWNCQTMGNRVCG